MLFWLLLDAAASTALFLHHVPKALGEDAERKGTQSGVGGRGVFLDREAGPEARRVSLHAAGKKAGGLCPRMFDSLQSLPMLQHPIELTRKKRRKYHSVWTPPTHPHTHDIHGRAPVQS